MNKKKRIPDEVLIRLVEEGKTYSQITSETGYTYNNVKVRLRQLGLVARRRDGLHKRVPDEILKKMVSEKMTTSEIARATDYSYANVRWRLKQLGLKPKQGEKPQKKVPDETLLKLAKQGISQRQIGFRVGLAATTISQRLKALGWKPVGIRTGRSRESIATDAKIVRMRAQKMTYKKIAEKIGISHQAVGYRLKRIKEKGLL